jgi:hypothetical protein
MTPAQIKILRTAVSRLGIEDGEYRLILRNLGHVDSCTRLTPEGFEDVMAHLEKRGFPAGHYWRNKVENRGNFADSRQAWLIRKLAESSPYPLAALCKKFSAERTGEPSKLTPSEANRLVEMLKASNARHEGTEPRRHEGPEGSGTGYQPVIPPSPTPTPTQGALFSGPLPSAKRRPRAPRPLELATRNPQLATIEDEEVPF